EDKCTECGDCLAVCPVEGAIVLQEAKAVIDRDLCTSCAACLPACAVGAIYEVQAAPMVPEQAQPAEVRRQPAPARAWPAALSALAAAAPVALDVLAGVAKRWIEERSVARKAPQGPGGGGRRRRQRARGRK
ncbi:MAG: indolepyruvate ferredoxin oxidoreductase subunit alpha, partial [Dehalococcoidia bacterium]